MNLSPNATAAPSTLHVDLGDIHAVSRALYCGQVSVQEARVAVALILDPDLKGLRSIEAASGLCDDTLLKVIPQTGFSSDLLTCRTRGVHSWEQEDRQPMVVEHRTSVGQEHLLSLQSLQDLREESFLENITQESITARQMTGVVDPSLDLWSNTGDGLGDAGWALAMVTLLKSVTFSLDDLERILRVGQRQVRRIVGKLGSWAKKLKTGRTVAVTVDFSMMVHEDLADDWNQRDRANRKLDLAQHERLEEQARDTRVGQAVKVIWANRVAEVRQLREYMELIPAMARQYTELMIRYLSAGPGEGPMARRRLRKLMDPLSV